MHQVYKFHQFQEIDTFWRINEARITELGQQPKHNGENHQAWIYVNEVSIFPNRKQNANLDCISNDIEQ
jgi:hypothetical protein